MRKPLGFIPLVLLICFTSLSAKEWSAEQSDALNGWNKYIAAALQGNIAEMKAFWHPEYVGWDLKQALPMNYDVFLKGEEEFFANYRFKKLECNPLAIQVEGNLAIIHMSYEDIFSDSSGKEISASGNWTTIMLKQGTKWAIMSSVWAEK